MSYNTDDLRIREIKELSPPSHLMREFPCTTKISNVNYEARDAVHKIIHGEDDRMVVVIGPCSIHDPKAALEYVKRLKAERERFKGELEIIMRVYFEKPRTTVGWKGLINDPGLDGSFNINKGLRLARQLLLAVNDEGVPAGCEFLDMITPQYIADLVSWGLLVPVLPKARCTVSWLPVFPVLLVSRTAPMAISRSPLMPSRRHPSHIIFCQLPKAAIPLLCQRLAMKIVT